MARLPQPGSDNGTWGDILNDYLSQTLKPDGTLKDDSVTNAAIAADAVNATSIVDGSITNAQLADGTIQEAKLSPLVQAKLDAIAPVTSVAGKTGDVTLTKSDVGLSNVDNTSDANKPIGNATLAALGDKTDKSSLTTKGDLYVATGPGAITRLGVGADGQVLTADSAQPGGLKWALSAGGSAIGYATNVGDGTVGPYTITHNLGSRDVLVNVYKNGGTFEEILVRIDRTTPNTIVLRPDETWTNNQYRVVVGFAAQSDVTPPTAPTLAVTGHDLSTVSLAVSGATDSDGIAGYNWYRNGSFIDRTIGTTYTHTGLDAATSYTFTATALDLSDNESVPSNTVAQSTDAPADVAYASTGAGNRTTSGGATSWTHTVSTGVSRYMIVGLITTHTSGQWGSYTGYTTRTVTSDISGALTFLGGAAIGVNGQWQGNAMLFGLANPAVGTHTLSVSIVRSGVAIAVMGNSVVYTGVGSVGTAVSYQPNASGALALSVTSATNNMAVGVAGFDNSPTSNSGTIRYSDGAAIGGQGDFGFIVDALGATTVNFTTSSTGHYRAGVGVNLIKAGS
jgi:hypothetical protein